MKNQISVLCSCHLFRNKNNEIESLRQINNQLKLITESQIGKDLELKTQELEVLKLTKALKHEKQEKGFLVFYSC